MIYVPSPYGMSECCICDADATHGIPADGGVLLPHCASCANAVAEEFPGTTVVLIREAVVA